jgi:hypothetical protein
MWRGRLKLRAVEGSWTVKHGLDRVAFQATFYETSWRLSRDPTAVSLNIVTSPSDYANFTLLIPSFP